MPSEQLLERCCDACIADIACERDLAAVAEQGLDLVMVVTPVPRRRAATDDGHHVTHVADREPLLTGSQQPVVLDADLSVRDRDDPSVSPRIHARAENRSSDSGEDDAED